MQMGAERAGSIPGWQIPSLLILGHNFHEFSKAGLGSLFPRFPMSPHSSGPINGRKKFPLIGCKRGCELGGGRENFGGWCEIFWGDSKSNLIPVGRVNLIGSAGFRGHGFRFQKNGSGSSPNLNSTAATDSVAGVLIGKGRFVVERLVNHRGRLNGVQERLENLLHTSPSHNQA
jgi:hypothetical protein